MKELGENLSELRKKNGVSLEEASSDLNVAPRELEAIENGNFKVFKDVYELKKTVTNYAKYLGINEEMIIDEFNDFLFEKTSRISKEEIDSVMSKVKEKEEKVSSPYTKIRKTRYDFAPIVLTIVFLVFISLIVYLILASVKKDEGIHRELMGRKEVIYELTK